MEDLIKKVSAAAGITDDQAKKSVETVSAYIKDRLPDSFKSQIDNLVNGGSLSEGVKSKMNDMAGDIREKTEEIISDVKEKFSEMFGTKDEKK